jgi:hypothetical protein
LPFAERTIVQNIGPVFLKRSRRNWQCRLDGKGDGKQYPIGKKQAIHDNGPAMPEMK